MNQITHDRTILLIDDNINNLKVAVQYLNAYSLNILTARNGEDGIKRTQLAQPDLILLDVQMPGIDGFEVCRRIKANPQTRSIPIIFMTALDQTNHIVRGFEAGAVDYITKPVDESELLARVTTQLRLLSLQEQLVDQNDQLEVKVQERTHALEQEIDLRKKDQAEKENLIAVINQQSEQLRQLTQLFLESQTAYQTTAQSSHQQVTADLGQLEDHLSQALALLTERSQKQSPQIVDLTLGHIKQARTILAHTQEQSDQVGATISQAHTEQEQLKDNPLFNLSQREYEIFRLLTQGKSNVEIGEMLFLAKTTVSTYRRRIMEKLNAADLSDLISIAVRHNLLS